MTSEAEAYNTAEFAALRVLELCNSEITTGVSGSAEMLDIIHDMNDRFGLDGVGSLVAALGRIGTTEMVVLAEQEGRTVAEHLEDWTRHKLQQHHTDDEDI